MSIIEVNQALIQLPIKRRGNERLYVSVSAHNYKLVRVMSGEEAFGPITGLCPLAPK